MANKPSHTKRFKKVGGIEKEARVSDKIFGNNVSTVSQLFRLVFFPLIRRVENVAYTRVAFKHI
jgi:hypothetical protein